MQSFNEMPVRASNLFIFIIYHSALQKLFAILKTMKVQSFFKTVSRAVLLIFIAASFALAQNAPNYPEPQQEKLLNGLKLLIWNDSQAPKVTVKLRIHNGAAFDPKDKMGVMALVADILFPTGQTKEFFREELQGSLDVATNYDYIEITATGKADEIQTILETIAAAVTKPPITKENFALVRDARLAKVRALEKNPDYVAERAAAKRLYGDFPYGRSAEGTSESLAKIERADLLQAEERFFTADNATLAVVGNVNRDFVYRAARRLFGAWQKSQQTIPATFRLPDPPNTQTLAIEMPESDRFVSRMAMNVAARNDKDFYATQILTRIWQKQFCLNNDAYFGKSDYQPYLLRGLYTVSKNVIYGKESLPINSGNCQLLLVKDGRIAYPPITQSDFETAKAAVLQDHQRKSLSDVADFWLDVDTYRLVSVKDEMSKLNNVTLADAQRVAEKLQKEPTVSIVVKRAEAAAAAKQ